MKSEKNVFMVQTINLRVVDLNHTVERGRTRKKNKETVIDIRLG